MAEHEPGAAPAAAAAPDLEISGLTKRFGGLRAVNAFDLSVAPGELAGCR